MPTVDEYSVTALPLELFFDDLQIATATGFLYKSSNQTFLVSNWHVFSGRNAYTGQPINEHGAIPNTVRFPTYRQNQFGRSTIEHIIHLEQTPGVPSWLQHPNGQAIDVAIIPYNDIPQNSLVYTLPRVSETTDMALKVAMDAFILGFPAGVPPHGLFPIWKRASIATEPMVMHEGLPVFLVDSATREGMSGAPVVVRSSGVFQNQQEKTIMQFGPATRFVGIYSGRFGADDSLSAQLGRVWHRSVIEEIIANGVLGTHVLSQ